MKRWINFVVFNFTFLLSDRIFRTECMYVRTHREQLSSSFLFCQSIENQFLCTIIITIKKETISYLMNKMSVMSQLVIFYIVTICFSLSSISSCAQIDKKITFFFKLNQSKVHRWVVIDTSSLFFFFFFSLLQYKTKRKKEHSTHMSKTITLDKEKLRHE